MAKTTADERMLKFARGMRRTNDKQQQQSISGSFSSEGGVFEDESAMSSSSSVDGGKEQPASRRHVPARVRKDADGGKAAPPRSKSYILFVFAALGFTVGAAIANWFACRAESSFASNEEVDYFADDDDDDGGAAPKRGELTIAAGIAGAVVSVGLYVAL